MLTAGLVLASVKVIPIPNVTVRNDRNSERATYPTDLGPKNRWSVALHLRPSVDREPIGAAFGGHRGIFVDLGDGFPSQPEFCRDGDYFGDGTSDGRDDRPDSARRSK